MLTTITLLASFLPGVLSLGILFPVYFCGNNANCFDTTSCPDYTSIVSGIKAQASVPVYMIINPASGPMTTSDLYPNYPVCIPQLKNAGPDSVVLGYVRTNYGNPPITADIVQENVTAYADWPASYRPTGIFFDEVSNDVGDVSLYESYATYARSLGFNFIVFNPGTSTTAGYFGSSAADMIVTYEGPYSSFSTSDLTITSDMPSAKQAVLMYSGPASSPSSVIDQLGSLGGGVGAVFVTDNANAANHWNATPTYWAAEVADVAGA
ncbi:unnamed protein product [Peniophora sp. CBMAI 1063]|nr:unnamed protein product [Peniophora sp. CBMAI 1063]